MIGTVVWIKPSGDRHNRQRARIEAIAAGHLMVTMLGTGDVECYPFNHVCGIEWDDSTSIQYTVIEERKDG